MSSLYQKYLLADKLVKRIEECGATAEDIAFQGGYWESREVVEGTVDERYAFMHSVSCAPGGLFAPEKREAFTERWLCAYPDTKLVRMDGAIYLRGTTHAGLTWLVNVGTGVCERVQVGTKKKLVIDPTYDMTSLPMVEVLEPIFEIRCGDPLREMVKEAVLV